MEILISGRECGDPQPGGFYAAIPLSRHGTPLREFLYDYPYPIPYGLEIKPRGLTLFQHEGIWHVADWIGEGNYPNFPDWWEEVNRLGFHQRVESTLDFSKLDPMNSKYFLAHPRGLIRSVKHYNSLYESVQPDPRLLYLYCPQHKHDEEWARSIEPGGMCINLLWHALLKGKPVENEEDGFVERKLKTFSYYGYKTDKKLKFEPAFMAAFPIYMMRWLLYQGKNGEEEKTLKNLDKKSPEWIKDNIQMIEAK